MAISSEGVDKLFKLYREQAEHGTSEPSIDVGVVFEPAREINYKARKVLGTKRLKPKRVTIEKKVYKGGDAVGLVLDKARKINEVVKETKPPVSTENSTEKFSDWASPNNPNSWRHPTHRQRASASKPKIESTNSAWVPQTESFGTSMSEAGREQITRRLKVEVESLLATDQNTLEECIQRQELGELNRMKEYFSGQTFRNNFKEKLTKVAEGETGEWLEEFIQQETRKYAKVILQEVEPSIKKIEDKIVEEDRKMKLFRVVEQVLGHKYSFVLAKEILSDESLKNNSKKYLVVLGVIRKYLSDEGLDYDDEDNVKKIILDLKTILANEAKVVDLVYKDIVEKVNKGKIGEGDETRFFNKYGSENARTLELLRKKVAEFSKEEERLKPYLKAEEERVARLVRHGEEWEGRNAEREKIRQEGERPILVETIFNQAEILRRQVSEAATLDNLFLVIDQIAGQSDGKGGFKKDWKRKLEILGKIKECNESIKNGQNWEFKLDWDNYGIGEKITGWLNRGE